MYLGPDGFSSEALKSEGIRAKYILAGKMRRYLSPMIFLDLLKMPPGFFQSYWHMFWFMPDVIFSKGGYGGVLPVIVGWMFRIPIIIHESDSVPGLANRILARLAEKIMLSFNATLAFFPSKKVILVGNPVRSELFTRVVENSNEALGIRSQKPIVLVIGGSQGARQINELTLLAVPELVKKYEIIHQCGAENLMQVQKGAAIQLKNAEEKALYHIYPVLSEDEIASAYALARVVVSRAGSGAIFEIAAAGKPSVLIPYAPAAGGHQEKNAHAYAQSGAAIVLEGENLTPHMIISEVDSIVENVKRSQSMSQAARNFAKPDAAGRIAEELLKFTTAA
jgi:UDP-N-acetylglucosamine--N-acetylmuramyl-(pentapeptide) pyrophosphoryl-undecaprenol N-acetylglucosamine transferase